MELHQNRHRHHHKHLQKMLLSSLLFLGVSVTISHQAATHNKHAFKSPCGNEKEVAHRIGQCVTPIFVIAEGRSAKPENDADLISLANVFADTEKCIRLTARECLTGLHKTTTSSVASSSGRFRKSEWKDTQSRSKYYEPVSCSIKNHTAIVQAIRDSNLKPEQKLAKSCCIFNELDRELKRVYNTECPQSSDIILKIVHSLTEDARSTVCVNPKCHNTLKPYLHATYKPPQIFIEPVMEILFSLSSDE